MKPLHRKIAVLAAGALLVLTMAGCTGDGRHIQESDVFEFSITLDDGTVLPCVEVRRISGFDCNWDKAVRSNTPTP